MSFEWAGDSTSVKLRGNDLPMAFNILSKLTALNGPDLGCREDTDVDC